MNMYEFEFERLTQGDTVKLRRGGYVEIADENRATPNYRWCYPIKLTSPKRGPKMLVAHADMWKVDCGDDMWVTLVRRAR